jgi:hypothetical protein
MMPERMSVKIVCATLKGKFEDEETRRGERETVSSMVH